MAMALTGKVAPYKKNFGPFRATSSTRPSRSRTTDQRSRRDRRDRAAVRRRRSIRRASRRSSSRRCRARAASTSRRSVFLKQLRALADAHGIVLVVDEIQSGIARTGKMLAIEHAGVKPDLVTLAKGLAGGFPLSAVVRQGAHRRRSAAGGLGGTYAGSPVGIAAAHAVLDVVDEEQTRPPARRRSARVCRAAESLAARQGMERSATCVGLGAKTAVEFVEDPATRARRRSSPNRVVAEAEKRG